MEKKQVEFHFDSALHIRALSNESLKGKEYIILNKVKEQGYMTQSQRKKLDKIIVRIQEKPNYGSVDNK